MQFRTSQSARQIEVDTPVHNTSEDGKLFKSVRTVQQIRQLLTINSTVKSIPDYYLDAAPLKEYNPQKQLSKQITFNEVNDEELQRYKAEWHWDVFFEFLFYHMLFLILLGPLVVLVLFKYPGIILLKNMKFFKHSSSFYMQTLLWMGSVLGGLMYFIQDKSVVTMTEIIFMWFAITTRSVVIAAKYATLSTARIKLYKTQELPDEMFSFDLMFQDWFCQSSKVLFLEQYRALRRHEQECTLYKFDFLIEPNIKTSEAIKNTNICFYLEWAMKQQMKQTDPIIEQLYYNGFHIFGYLVNQFQQNNPQSSFYKYLISLSLFYGISPIFIRLKYFMENIPDWFDLIRLLLNFITSLQAFFGSVIVLAIGIYDFKRKFFLLDQCLYMLQAKKVTYSTGKKLIPTINFNNPQTLQAWSIIRSLSFDYGQTYNLRIQGFYSMIFGANIVLIFVSLGLILDLIHIDMFQLMLISEMALILIGFTLYYLYLGASLNEYFDSFQTLLDDVKSIYCDILRMREQYILNNIQPINDVHKIFVYIIKEQIGLDVDNIKEYIELIIEELENNQRQLEYDRRNNPFKLYGVLITLNLLKSVGVGLSTVFSYAIQQRLSNEQK
ncbi:unnamed protein product [Paramecium pentaurelia]|uniref:Transmembrane protein n=1 Tax=Paramecium pentaurelia TaxID=43138 RepID=A0A8S1TKJ4_9CILI|nr:unnamed protein product [Paramecium pentaurelia]